jgi:hypothetical protein
MILTCSHGGSPTGSVYLLVFIVWTGNAVSIRTYRGYFMTKKSMCLHLQ